MTDNFESRKNTRAGGYTALVCALLLVIFLFVRWGMPVIQPPPVEEGMEVNLGSSDAGLGNDQPFEPGEPAPAQQQQAYTPPQPTTTQDDNVKDIATDDKDEEAPEIKKPPVVKPKPDATKIPEKEVAKKPVTKPKPVENPAPPAPKPKAVFKGTAGNGTGGNDADTYKKGGNEGVAGGTGDQGRPGGNPDSKNYTGGGKGNTGIRVANGLSGRHVAYAYKYQDDFNENATVAVDVRVDKSGNVLSASYQLRGSTTSENFYKEKAVQIVKKSKFNAAPNGPDEQTGTVLVNFKVRG